MAVRETSGWSCVPCHGIACLAQIETVEKLLVLLHTLLSTTFQFIYCQHSVGNRICSLSLIHIFGTVNGRTAVAGFNSFDALSLLGVIAIVIV